MQRNADLLEIVLTFHAIGGLAYLLHGGEKQANQHSNNGDDDEKLDQGKSGSMAHHIGSLPKKRLADDGLPESRDTTAKANMPRCRPSGRR
jgi:hypothetical protein